MNEEMKNHYNEYWELREGKLYWKKINPHNYRAIVGDEVGLIDSHGYRIVSFKGKNYKAHRVIWYCEYNEIPNQIDHINGIKDDNRLCNIRNVTVVENSRNIPKPKNNTSGHIGVVFIKSGKRLKRWRAEIKVNSKKIILGQFITIEEAIEARKLGEIEYGFHENHGR